MKSITLTLRVLAQVLAVGAVLNSISVLAQSSSSLRINTIVVARGSPTEFRFVDQGNGATNYTVEFSPVVGAAAAWTKVDSAVITDLGGGNFRVVVPSSQTSSGFYRVRGGAGVIIATFVTTAFQVSEGATVAPSITFNAPFLGTVRYTVSGTAGSGDFAPLSGEVVVNGTNAVIPITLTDNLSIGELKYLSLRLEPGSGYRPGTTSESRISIDENDAEWQGSFVTGKASVGFILKIQRSGAEDRATLRSDGFGFFPTNEIPASLILAENTFRATVPNIPMPANATLLNSEMSLLFELNAVNGQTNQSVSSTLIQGNATLITTIPGREYLNNTNRGTFVLLKSPVKPSTNEVQLVAKP